MAGFKCEIFKKLGSEVWENGYVIFSSSLVNATSFATSLAASERLFHSEEVSYLYIRLSPLPHVDNEFVTIPLAYNGARTAGDTGQLLPLWNVLKLYLQPATGRPDYKLYRGVLGEANSGSGVVGSGTAGLVRDTIVPFTSTEMTESYLVTGDDEEIADVVADNFIRERQLHRRKKRAPAGGLVSPS